jgi:hypothetical protein
MTPLEASLKLAALAGAAQMARRPRWVKCYGASGFRRPPPRGLGRATATTSATLFACRAAFPVSPLTGAILTCRPWSETANEKGTHQRGGTLGSRGSGVRGIRVLPTLPDVLALERYAMPTDAPIFGASSFSGSG